MKKVLLSVGLFAMTMTAKAQVISFDAGLKGAYSATEMFNNNISDLGAIQDYRMSTGSNYGVALNANLGKIGLSVEFLPGTFNTGYQGTIGSGNFASTYTSNVELKTFSIPILVRLGGQTGGYAEVGISTNGVKLATYSNSLSTATADVTGKYNSYTTAVLGFGSNISLGDSFPLILNVGVRLQYGITDAAGVDALGNDLTNTNAYPTYQKSSAASAGLHVGLTYKIK
ncbi:MAG: hypothetical protein KA736_06575 [Crocinitomicaceae bacterium]|nr:hypothetical protein [Crocinitomicaceae bacterium]MBP6033012.1 hypothetical protein [Crocinitomicaceae bacterium]